MTGGRDHPDHPGRESGSADKQTSANGAGVVQPPVDAPIQHASDDRLRRAPYAERNAEVVTELVAAGARVYAIRGPWGTAKTSLKNLILERIADRGEHAVDFNAYPRRLT